MTSTLFTPGGLELKYAQDINDLKMPHKLPNIDIDPSRFTYTQNTHKPEHSIHPEKKRSFQNGLLKFTSKTILHELLELTSCIRNLCHTR